MAAIKYPGVCDFCGKECKAGGGDFQSVGSLPPDIKKYHVNQHYTGKWLIRCYGCKNVGNETIKYKQLSSNK